MRPFLSRMLFFYLVLIEIQVVASAQTSAARRQLRIPGRRSRQKISRRTTPIPPQRVNQSLCHWRRPRVGHSEISRACWQRSFGPRLQARESPNPDLPIFRRHSAISLP